MYFSGSSLNLLSQPGQQKYTFLPLYSVKTSLLMAPPIMGQVVCWTLAPAQHGFVHPGLQDLT